MLVICEDCGKKYRLDRTKLGLNSVKFKCKACAHLITLPDMQNTGNNADDHSRRLLAMPSDKSWKMSGSNLPVAPTHGGQTKVERNENSAVRASLRDAVTAIPDNPVPSASDAIPVMLSLRSKMLFLFVVLPAILFTSSAVLFFYQTDRLEHSFTGQSSAIITRMAEAKITNRHDLAQPITALKAHSQALVDQIKSTITTVLGITLLIIGVTVSIFVHYLTARVRSLTDAADRISIGDLEVEIPIHSRDEFGKLAEAISRMQDSIRLSIERLRRR